MPDASYPQPRTPRDWRDTFAALPQEAPPARAWETLSTRLDARRTRRWPAWLALAAALALVALLPLRQAGDGSADEGTHTGPVQVAATPRQRAPTGSRDPLVAAAQTSATNTQPGSAPANIPSATATPINVAKAPPKPSTKQPRITVAKPATAAPAIEVAGIDNDATDDDARALQPLYAESARLETLLALARDERVANASAVLLSDALDAQIADIDASLSVPGLDDAQRLPLWQARVAALRQAAGFESTQRLLASHGQGNAMLVSID